MADQEARFAIELDVKGQQESEKLADSLAHLREQLKADQAAVTELQEALKRLKQVSEVNEFLKLSTALPKQIQALKASRASLAELNAEMAKLQSGTSVDIDAFRGDGRTADAREGIAAFLGKRAAKFGGR